MTHKTARDKKFLCFFVLLLLGVLNEACVTLADPKPKSSGHDPLPQYWLTTSMYAGRFYDNNQLNLIDYRPFSAIDDVETVDAFILYPPKPDRIIPAGTLVRLLDISYPDELHKLKRPIYSPRNNIWVYLQIAKERGKVSLFLEKTHILVVPSAISTEQQLRGYLGRFLSQRDPNQWILTLASHLQAGIHEKRPLIGMKKEHLLAALGPPIKKQFQKKGNFQDAQEIWHYHNYLIILIDNVVHKIKPLSNGLADQMNPKPQPKD